MHKRGPVCELSSRWPLRPQHREPQQSTCTRRDSDQIQTAASRMPQVSQATIFTSHATWDRSDLSAHKAKRKFFGFALATLALAAFRVRHRQPEVVIPVVAPHASTSKCASVPHSARREEKLLAGQRHDAGGHVALDLQPAIRIQKRSPCTAHACFTHAGTALDQNCSGWRGQVTSVRWKVSFSSHRPSEDATGPHARTSAWGMG